MQLSHMLHSNKETHRITEQQPGTQWMTGGAAAGGCWRCRDDGSSGRERGTETGGVCLFLEMFSFGTKPLPALLIKVGHYSFIY